MKVYNILVRIRNKLADTIQPFLWSDNELLDYINDTLNFIFSEIETLEFEYTIKTVANTKSYTLPSDFDRELSIYCDDIKLAKIPLGELNSLPEGTGKPVYYAIFDNKIHFNPIPDKEYDVYLYYIRRASPSITADDELNLPLYMISALEYGILWKAYMKEDSETFDFKLAQYYYNLFISAVSFFRARYVRKKDIPRPSIIHRGLL